MSECVYDFEQTQGSLKKKKKKKEKNPGIIPKSDQHT